MKGGVATGALCLPSLGLCGSVFSVGATVSAADATTLANTVSNTSLREWMEQSVNSENIPLLCTVTQPPNLYILCIFLYYIFNEICYGQQLLMRLQASILAPGRQEFGLKFTQK